MNVLILSPHTDDGEFGCGGSIARFISEGKKVFYAAFSIAERSVPPKYPRDILKNEVKEATGVLGIRKENLILFDYITREFPSSRQSILDDILILKKKLKPDMVMLPSTYDTHQDHQVIVQEGFRAFKNVTMMGYEMPRNNLSFPTNVFVAFKERELRLKIKAIECYRSQAKKHLPSPNELYEMLARLRGAQVDLEYAEVFEAIRWVMK